MIRDLTATSIHLLPDHPAHSSKQPGALRDDILEVDQIQCYDHNPRLLPNPKWSDIKASIKASKGLTDTLPVTKRPGDDHYIVHQGGNTRLQALKELFKETGEEAFRWVRVDVRPYRGEFDLAALHHRENTCRGNLTYFEQAWSKYNQYQLYCQDRLGKPNAAKFIQHLRSTYGDPITPHAFSRMKFAVEVLFQHIPTCLVQGAMSQRAVRNLIAIRTSLLRMWEDHELGTTGDFDNTFYCLLNRQDNELATAYLSKDRDSATLPDDRIAIDWPYLFDDIVHELTIIADVDHQRAETWLAAALPSFAASATSDAPLPSPKLDHAATHQTRQAPSLTNLRARAFQLAKSLAATADLSDNVQPTSDAGFGYCLVSAPEARSLSPQAHACWSALAISAGVQDTHPVAPSIDSLQPRQISLWSNLLAVHARIARITAPRAPSCN